MVVLPNGWIFVQGKNPFEMDDLRDGVFAGSPILGIFSRWISYDEMNHMIHIISNMFGPKNWGILFQYGLH